MDWLAKNASKLLIGAAGIALVLALITMRSCSASQTARTETRLAAGQAGAAIESGTDAVQTIGNAQTNETEIHAIVKDSTDAIQAAPAGNSNDAADRAACRLRSYRNTGKCVALLGPVAK
jgi:hypothetical protein